MRSVGLVGLMHNNGLVGLITHCESWRWRLGDGGLQLPEGSGGRGS